MKRIILTGGGTAGHVTPNIALVPKLKEKGYDIQYYEVSMDYDDNGYVNKVTIETK